MLNALSVDDAAFSFHPTHRAVRAKVAAFHLILPLTLDGPLYVFTYHVPVVRMNKLEDAVQRPAKGPRRLSMDRLHIVGPLDLVCADVPIEGACVGGLQVEAISFQNFFVPGRPGFT